MTQVTALCNRIRDPAASFNIELSSFEISLFEPSFLRFCAAKKTEQSKTGSLRPPVAVLPFSA
jgi:hypothetical protein